MPLVILASEDPEAFARGLLILEDPVNKQAQGDIIISAN
jgi:hypothetical protein